MLIDTHCHINMIVKREFDRPLSDSEYDLVPTILEQASTFGVNRILNVGTSLTESVNCIELAKRFKNIFAAIGIHPNDLTDDWINHLEKLSEYLKSKEQLKIVAIGECGIDKHYPGFNLERQRDAFRRQIELALTHDVALVVHSRDAAQETLDCLAEYSKQGLKGTIHCFSEDLSFAHQAISWGFVLGIGGTITYPKNEQVRSVVKAVGIKNIILETDAPFLPPQSIRGKQNMPSSIALIASFLSELMEVSVHEIAQTTSENAIRVFSMGD